jgi:hypothetical protein
VMRVITWLLIMSHSSCSLVPSSGLTLFPMMYPRRHLLLSVLFAALAYKIYIFPLRRALVNLCEALKSVFGFKTIGVYGLVFTEHEFSFVMTMNL